MARRLLYLNGLAIIAVVLFHAAGMGFVAMFHWSHRYAGGAMIPEMWVGTPTYYTLRLIEQLIVFAIPTFLFVSGYSVAVAAGRSQETVSWKLVLNRIRVLVIPYLVWSAVVIALRVLESRRVTPAELFSWIFTGSSNEVFYFVPLLIQFYLLSPWLVRWARYNWKGLLLVTGLLQVGVQLLAYPELMGWQSPVVQSLSSIVPKWFFLARIFWFPLGIICGLYPTQFRQILFRYAAHLISITVFFILLGVLEWEAYYRLAGQNWLSHRETLLDNLYTLALLFSLLAVDAQSLPWVTRISNLGVRSYGIYLTHSLFIVYLSRFIYKFFPDLLGYPLLLQPALIGAGLLIPLAMMAFIDRSRLRRLYNYLYG